MEEDLEFNRFLRNALESEGAFRVPAAVPRAARRHRWLWRISLPALLAASVVLIALFHATFATPSDRVSDAIELLSLTDGFTLDGESTADLLLAWQDAPCYELL